MEEHTDKWVVRHTNNNLLLLSSRYITNIHQYTIGASSSHYFITLFGYLRVLPGSEKFSWRAGGV
jgi:hypothetical protein